MSVPSKEEMLKKLSSPQMATNSVNKFFADLDPENTGFITVEGFFKRADELTKQYKAPDGGEAQKKAFEEVVAKNSTDGKMTRENLQVVMELFFKNVVAHMQNAP